MNLKVYDHMLNYFIALFLCEEFLQGARTREHLLGVRTKEHLPAVRTNEHLAAVQRIVANTRKAIIRRILVGANTRKRFVGANTGNIFFIIYICIYIHLYTHIYIYTSI